MKLLLAMAALTTGAACQPEPERACTRVRFGWPYFELTPSSDVSVAPGLQIDIELRSDLEGGIRATLSIAEGEQDPAIVATAVSQADGRLSFEGVTVPEGEVVFLVDAADECGRHRGGARTFVWDGLGYPACTLRLASGPLEDPQSPWPLLRAEHDEDPETEGMQTRVIVESGRPDMEISLFVLDRETGEDRSFELTPNDLGTAEHEVTLAEGEQAMRAVCFWPARELRQSSPTWTYLVDIEE
jgi:hypothetical protein